MIPMLNPDAVYRGHYRVDTQGNNLNRFYKNPSFDDQPTIYAARELFLNLHGQKKLFFYCDLHAHANKKGAFIFGNHLNYREMIDSYTFARLLTMNNPYFNFKGCNFQPSNMDSKDRAKDSKDGTGRVGLFMASKLPHCYTLEVNYRLAIWKNHQMQ